ncbi:hypothetical protein [Acinetobacter ursingii]|uniref:Bbp19 family protein n=1 Tax=Acinetobacter ursingii TaxID=108980 RepID=UPI003008D2A6
MIIGIAVMLVVGLILATGWWNEVNKNRELKQQLIDEQEAKAKLLPKDESKDPEVETGIQVKRRYYRPVTAETYRNLFDIDVNGVRVLEHLTSIFCKSTYVRGGQEAERESCFRAGERSVVEFIIKQINRANDPNYKEEVND